MSFSRYNPEDQVVSSEAVVRGLWSGDSNTVEDLPREHMSRKGGIDAVSFVKNKVIDLMATAQKKGIEMTKYLA